MISCGRFDAKFEWFFSICNNPFISRDGNMRRAKWAKWMDGLAVAPPPPPSLSHNEDECVWCERSPWDFPICPAFRRSITVNHREQSSPFQLMPTCFVHAELTRASHRARCGGGCVDITCKYIILPVTLINARTTDQLPGGYILALLNRVEEKKCLWFRTGNKNSSVLAWKLSH